MSPSVDDPRMNSAATAETLGWTRGLCFVKFAGNLSKLDLQVYEKNDDIAGTWWENVYPGCACDIPAHIYQFMWALNPFWSHYYADGKEILQYFQDVADKYGLRKYVKVRHTVVDAKWDSATAKWTVELQQADGTKFTDTCDFLVNGCGLLNNWK
ncbi:hypothetical protein OIDMADRAFT_60459 [Oidiodendron maius Zn]|uniref:Uncharacterized protein n=1 Tax=Oidiodendron maius (strain Zn) TaxID=913774 RepID=A0A0C3CYE9_OIDMZ|nr:hypothetical protein OIDMADRAFT_60459 [Oidiodendron maius Zn]